MTLVPGDDQHHVPDPEDGVGHRHRVGHRGDRLHRRMQRIEANDVARPGLVVGKAAESASPQVDDLTVRQQGAAAARAGTRARRIARERECEGGGVDPPEVARPGFAIADACLAAPVEQNPTVGDLEHQRRADTDGFVDDQRLRIRRRIIEVEVLLASTVREDTPQQDTTVAKRQGDTTDRSADRGPAWP